MEFVCPPSAPDEPDISFSYRDPSIFIPLTFMWGVRNELRCRVQPGVKLPGNMPDLYSLGISGCPLFMLA